jgi:hypothetical protein
MRNGFTVIGKSAPASAANFNAELGKKLAYEDAIRQLWPLMGFSLRDRLHRGEQGSGLRRIEAIAAVCHEVNRAYCQSQADQSQPTWEDAPQWQRASAIAGVWFAIEHPDAKPSDSHESWLAEKVRDGWVYGPVKDPQLKQHPCMVAYDELPPEQRAKDHIFLAVVRSLIDRLIFGD